MYDALFNITKCCTAGNLQLSISHANRMRVAFAMNVPYVGAFLCSRLCAVGMLGWACWRAPVESRHIGGFCTSVTFCVHWGCSNYEYKKKKKSKQNWMTSAAAALSQKSIFCWLRGCLIKNEIFQLRKPPGWKWKRNRGLGLAELCVWSIKAFCWLSCGRGRVITWFARETFGALNITEEITVRNSDVG